MTTHIAYPDELLDDDKLTKLYDKVSSREKLLAVALMVQLVALFLLLHNTQVGSCQIDWKAVQEH